MQQTLSTLSRPGSPDYPYFNLTLFQALLRSTGFRRIVSLVSPCPGVGSKTVPQFLLPSGSLRLRCKLSLAPSPSRLLHFAAAPAPVPASAVRTKKHRSMQDH